MGKHLFFLTSIFSSILLSAQPMPKPKLVVGIVVDQMRYDYIYRFWDKYSEGGFKRLVNEGFFCKNTNYNYVPTYTAPGHAAIYTGTTPAINGIVGNDWFDRAQGKIVYCVNDSAVTSVGSMSKEGKRSPVNLLTSTLTDELRLAYNMKSKVIAIGLKDRSAILPGGHTANAAYWFDGSNGNFISSTYYMKELPNWLMEFNAKKLPEKYLSKPWTTLLPIEQYTESLSDDNAYETVLKGELHPIFPHDLPTLMATNNGLSLIRTTPFGNSLLKELAMKILASENMGKSDVTDFLAISFSSTDYIGHAYGPNSIELEDCYLRLDKDLADLLNAIDAQVGKKNALVFLTADHAAPQTPQYLSDLRIPAGYINETKIADTLKKYLNSVYGSPLVQSYINQQIYLDHKQIETKKLLLKDVQYKTAIFLQSLPYISEIVTGATLPEVQYTEPPKSLMQKGFNNSRSGDVLVNYTSGYADYQPTGTTHGSPYSYDTHVPLLFYGWNIKAGSSVEPVEIIDIAATLSMLLNIQFPSGCTGKPILSVLK